MKHIEVIENLETLQTVLIVSFALFGKEVQIGNVELPWYQHLWTQCPDPYY